MHAPEHMCIGQTTHVARSDQDPICQDAVKGSFSIATAWTSLGLSGPRTVGIVSQYADSMLHEGVLSLPFQQLLRYEHAFICLPAPANGSLMSQNHTRPRDAPRRDLDGFLWRQLRGDAQLHSSALSGACHPGGARDVQVLELVT